MPRKMQDRRYRIGVDIGGTFTDFALFDDDSAKVWTHKQLTTPAAPADAVVEGVAAVCAKVGIDPADVSTIVHGTTLVTNAIIERKGVPTAMLVTRGFRDTLDIAMERRYDLFDLRLQFPKPVVPRSRRLEVTGRLKADGTEELPLDLNESLRRDLEGLVERCGIAAVAICFLHSYRDDSHEAAALGWVQGHFPELAVCASSKVFPFIREYERWTTATLNAYVQPVVDRYIAMIEDGLAGLGFAGEFLVMSSSGGTLTAEVARRFPIRLLESGPAAGALMSARHGRDLGELQVLSFDMGGTTAKGCIIQGGAALKRYELEVARVHEFKKGSGLPAKIPVIDMIEIGAGGGSLAEIDERRTLRVGPRSAGAMPGPACYGRGGDRATLTDANLVLGYLSSASFLGGTMSLDVEAARRSLDRNVARGLSVSIEDAAWGIHEVINEDVARAFRIHASERGVDYRNCSLIVFGGSGPLHGARIARKLRIPRIICPWGAGVMSAFGLLASPVGFEFVRSKRRALAEFDEASFAAERERLGQEAAAFLLEAGIAPGAIGLRFKLDMRYEGQGYEVEVDLPDGTAQEVFARLPTLFGTAYRKVFGTAFSDRRIEMVSWKVEACGPVPGEGRQYRLHGQRAGTAERPSRPAFFPDAGGFVPCRVYDRYRLAAGVEIAGPALVEESESTCVLAPGDRGQIDDRGNLVIKVGASA